MNEIGVTRRSRNDECCLLTIIPKCVILKHGNLGIILPKEEGLQSIVVDCR